MVCAWRLIRNIKTMWKSGTLDLEDINAALIDERKWNKGWFYHY